MTYNEEMASILITNNLATEETIRSLWYLVDDNNTIGMVLVQNNLLQMEIYNQLANFMTQQGKTVETTVHPPQTPEQGGGIDVVAADPSMTIEVDSYQPNPSQAYHDTPVDGYAQNDMQQLHDSPMTQEQSIAPKPPQETATPQETIDPPHGVSAENSLPLNFMQPSGTGQLTEAVPGSLNQQSTINQILLFARSIEATDVHICCDTPITCRVAGTLKPVTDSPLNSTDVERIIRQILQPDQVRELEESGDLEFVYTIQGAGRFRSTAIRYRKGWSLTARLIPVNFRSVTDIGLPASCLDLTKWAQGLILITGPAGCGKSTTLSTLIEYINENRNEHIITIENPIENIYPKAKSQVVQREVGLHTLSQNNALRGALRQDPDILVISELRDLESIQLAVSAAETGHLVFGTMNTTDAIRTIDRLIGSFPSDEQPIIRSMVSESLRGVISQRLLPSKNGNSVVPAFEVLKVTSPVSNMIRKNETHQLKSTMITGRKDGMVVFDDSLEELIKEGRISKETAHLHSEDKTRFA